MTYETFKERIIDAVNEALGTGVKVTIQRVQKNNGLELDGLTIIDGRTNIAPTIYLNYYYHLLSDGRRDLQEIITDILETYEEHRMNSNIDLNFFTDFERVKDKIVFKLINTKQNSKLLEQIANINFLDLSIVFYYLFDSTDSGSATILIRNEHLNYWNVDTDTLFQYAKENTPKLLKSKLNSMMDILAGIESTEEILNCTDELLPMYVLTNHTNMFGAATMLYDNVLKSFADKKNSDFYILPSSVHELILIPASTDMDSDYLTSMVQEVNDTQVPNEEILSDHAYYYNRTTNQITY